VYKDQTYLLDDDGYAAAESNDFVKKRFVKVLSLSQQLDLPELTAYPGVGGIDVWTQSKFYRRKLQSFLWNGD
jgi:hypothetical protein